MIPCRLVSVFGACGLAEGHPPPCVPSENRVGLFISALSGIGTDGLVGGAFVKVGPHAPALPRHRQVPKTVKASAFSPTAVTGIQPPPYAPMVTTDRGPKDLPCFCYTPETSRKLLALGDPYGKGNEERWRGGVRHVARVISESFNEVEEGWRHLEGHAWWLYYGAEVVELSKVTWKRLIDVPADYARAAEGPPAAWYVVLEEGPASTGDHGFTRFEGLYLHRVAGRLYVAVVAEGEGSKWWRTPPWLINPAFETKSTDLGEIFLDRIAVNLARALGDERVRHVQVVDRPDRRHPGIIKKDPVKRSIRRLSLTVDPLSVWRTERELVADPSPSEAEGHSHASPGLHRVTEHTALYWYRADRLDEPARAAAAEEGLVRTREGLDPLYGVRRQRAEHTRGSGELVVRRTRVELAP